MDETPLPTVAASADLVTATVPSRLYSAPGIKEVFLLNPAGESNRVEFVVTPANGNALRSGERT